MSDNKKTCRRCKEAKPLAEYNKRAKSPDGLRPTCRSCDSEIRKGATMEAPKPAPEPVPTSPKVIGRIGVAESSTPESPAQPVGAVAQPRITVEEATSPEDQRLAKEFAAILNKKLPVRTRAKLLVSIAKEVKGPAAALALSAIRDINLATGVTTKTGIQVETAPMFVIPAGSGIRMSGS